MEDSTKKILAGVAVIAVLIVSGTVWAVMSRDTGPDINEVRQMGQELRDKMQSEEGKNMTPEQRREMWRNYQEKVDRLTFEQKKKLFEERAQSRGDRPDPVHDFYTTQSADERNAILDKQIEQELKRDEARKQREAERAQKAAESGGANPGGAAGGQPGNGPSPQQQQQWDNRRREFLDMRTPQQRAQRSDYRLQVRERAKQTGQPIPSGGGFGGFGGGGPRGGGGGGPAGGAPPVTP